MIFIFGFIGNILNFLVLSNKKLRSNPCAYLFRISSFINLISILIGLPTRILAGWNIDPTTTINWICKFRAFTVFSTRTMVTWLIALATIDRWFLSSVDIHRRHMSNLKNTKREIILIVILSSLVHLYMIYCYEANITDAPLKCYAKTKTCRLINDLTYAFITITIPFILMITFGLMTISNVRHLQHRIEIRVSRSKEYYSVMKKFKLKPADHHLLHMLLIEAFLLIVLYIPQAVRKFYITFKLFGSGSEFEDLMKVFVYNIELLLAFISSCMPFYIYTLGGGPIFRNAFMDLLRKCLRKIRFGVQS